MAERAGRQDSRVAAPRGRTFGAAADSARQQFAWIWSRESLLRLALSFVLAIALWLYITDKQNPNVAQDFPQPLPIETANLGNGLTVTMSVTTVRVRYRSDAPDAIVTAVNFHPFVDLSGLRAGPPRFVPVQVVPDPGIHVVQTNPSRVLVTVDRIETRTLRVAPRILTPAPTGYAIGAIRVEPGTVSVTGPHSLVSEVNAVGVDIDLHGVTATLDNSYKPILQDSQGAPLTGSSRLELDPPQVQVHIPVTPLSSLKTLPVLVPLQGHVKSGYRLVSIVTTPQAVTAKGAPSSLSAITQVWTAPVSLSGRQRTFTARVGLQLARGVTANSSSVQVTVAIQALHH